jgi:hypothetical protein
MKRNVFLKHVLTQTPNPTQPFSARAEKGLSPENALSLENALFPIF